MKKVYFISGLGADKRVFSFLEHNGYEPVFLSWIDPLKNESLESYAQRLRKQVPEDFPTIVGISFGGMLLTEMAKHDAGIKGIIISSNKIAAEFPSWLRIGKYLPLYKWAPAGISKKMMLSNTWILGGKKPEHEKLLKQIIRESDMQFTKWAIGAILRWKNSVIPENIIHIHGTADKLLPCRLVKANYIIKNGTHVMTMDQHAEVSALLHKLVL